MKIFSELVDHGKFEYITEATENKPKIYKMRGIMMEASVKNRNGRVYPSELLEREIDKYNEEKLPWIPLLRRMFEIDYNMDYAKVESILNDFKWFNFQLLTNEEMIAWIKANTSLQEVENWKFLIYPETTWLNWEIIEAKYLTIE